MPRQVHRRVLHAALARAAAVAAPAWAQSTADVEQPAALIKAAQAEGQLMLYSSSDENQSRTLLAAFEKRYGIKGSFIRFPTGPLMQRFSTEYDAKNIRADIVSVSSPIPYDQTPDRYITLDRTVLPNLAKWPDFKVAGKYTAWTTDLVALIYNTEQLKPGEVPKTWSDLADPKWKGKFLLTNPTVADNYLGWLDAIERALGVEFLRKLAKQETNLTQSGASGAQMVAAGSVLFNAPTFASFAAKLLEKKAPVAVHYPQGPAIVSPRNIAIVAGAPHPNAAKLYLNWLLSEEGMKLTCSISPTTLAMAPDSSRGCLAVPEGVAMRFDIPEERKRMLAKELGVAR